MSPIHLGLDLGTSGCRGIAIDDGGELLAESAMPLPDSVKEADGKSEQNPSDWLEAALQTLANLAGRLGSSAGRAASLAIDGTSASQLAVDAEGTLLAPALMYDDRRASDEAKSLVGIAPVDSPVLSASASLPKLLYLRKWLNRDFLALHQADWLLGSLCGHFGDSDENNCLKMGYDAITRAWPTWMQRLALPDGMLPRVHPVGTPVGTLAPHIAKATGLPEQLHLFTGTTDSTAAAMATGIDRPGQAVTVLGSTLVMKVLSSRPVLSAAHGVYSHRLGDLWLAGGASNSGGAVLLAHFDRDRLAAMTPLLEPDRPTGLDYYPLSRPGERFPLNDPGLQPRLSPRPGHDVCFFQAMLEGIARIEAEAYALLERLGTPRVVEVHTIGGGAANPAWRRIRQDRLGVPVITSPHQQAAYGAALIAKAGFQRSFRP